MYREKNNIKVKILDPTLRLHNGLFHHYGREQAIKGEQLGKWIIVDEEENIEENKSLTNKDYLNKTGFKNISLGKKDLFR